MCVKCSHIFSSSTIGSKVSIPGRGPLGKILGHWQDYGYKPLTKKKLLFCCNTAWPMYILDSGECWLLNGSLDYYTTLQLEVFCQRSEKWDEIPYVQMFMGLHNVDASKEENKLMVRRQTPRHRNQPLTQSLILDQGN